METSPLETPENAARLDAMGDAFADLRLNMERLAETHNAVSDFNESFASLFLGLQVHMFCNSFPGLPARDHYEAMERERSCELKNAELRAKIRAARLQNAELKQAQRQRPEPRPSLRAAEPFSQRPAAARIFSGPQSRSKIPVARDDSCSLTDSFVDAPPAAKTGLPNLNQQPRYMRGLFEIPGASNTRRYGLHHPEKKPERTTRVPAARALYRNTAAPSSAQQAAGYAAPTSARQRASLAAQRAQKARAERLASRPPFR